MDEPDPEPEEADEEEVNSLLLPITLYFSR